MFFSTSLNVVTFFLILILLTSIALVLCIKRFKQSSDGIWTNKNSAYYAVTIPPINKTSNATTSELPEYVNIQPAPMISTGMSGETIRSSLPNCPTQPLGVDSTYTRANVPSAAEKTAKHSLLKSSKDFFSFKAHALFRTGRASLQTSPTRATFTDSLILVENASIQQLYRCNDSSKGVPTKQIRRYVSDSRCQSEIPSRVRSHSAEVERSVLKKLKKPATYVNIDDWKQEIQDKAKLPVQSRKYQNTCISHLPPCGHMSLDDLCDIPMPKHQQWKKTAMDYNDSAIPSSQPTHHEYVNSILLLSRESTPDTETLSPMDKEINDLELSSASIHMEKHKYVNLHPSTSINASFSQELYSAFDSMISSDDETLQHNLLKQSVDSDDENETQTLENISHVSNGNSQDLELSSLKQNEVHHLRDQFVSSENSSKKHDYVNLMCLPPSQFDIPIVSPCKPSFAAITLSKSSQHHDSLMVLDIADKNHDHEYTTNTPFYDFSIKIRQPTENTSTNEIYTEEATEVTTVTTNSSLTSSKKRADSDDENKTQDPKYRSHESIEDSHDQKELSSLKQNEGHHLRNQYLRDQFASSENSSEKHDYVNLTCLSPSPFDTSIINPVDLCTVADTLSKSSRHHMDLDIADKNHDPEYSTNTSFCDNSIGIENDTQNTSTNEIYTKEATEESTVTINSSTTSSKERVDSDSENKTQDPKYRSHESIEDSHDQKELSSLKQNEAHHLRDHYLRDQFVSSENSSEKHDYVNLACLSPSPFDTSIINPVDLSLVADTLSKSSQHHDSLVDLDIADKNQDHEYTTNTSFCDISIEIENDTQNTSTNEIYTKEATEESTVTINSSTTSSKERVDSDAENKTQDPEYRSHASIEDSHDQKELSSLKQNEAHNLRDHFLRDQFVSSENSSEKHDYVNLACLSPSPFDTSIINPVDLCSVADTLSKSSRHHMDLDIADKNHDPEYSTSTSFCDISIEIENDTQNTSTNEIYTKEATEESTVTINSSTTLSKERVDSDAENKTQDPEYRSHASIEDTYDQEELSSLKQNEAYHLRDHFLRDQIVSSENSSEKHDYVNLTSLPPSQFATSIISPIEQSSADDTLSKSSQYHGSLMDLHIEKNDDHEYIANTTFCDISIKIEEHPETTSTYEIYKEQATEEGTVTIMSSLMSSKEGAIDTKICFDEENFNKNQEPSLPSSHDVTTTQECSDGSGHIIKALRLL